MKIVIHAGNSWSRWSPHPCDFETQAGLGGSQLAASRIAHALALLDASYQVVLIGDFTEKAMQKEASLPNLAFKPIKDYQKEMQDESRAIDLLVVSRYPQFLRFGAHIRRVFFWCHDVEPMDSLPSSRKESGESKESRFAMLALSTWHKRHLESVFPKQTILQTSNGLEPSLFSAEPWPHKVQNRFIYSSALYRGLGTVLNCWPSIRARLPDATLHIYCDFASPLVVSRMNALGKELQQKAESLKREGVSCFGFVGQRQLQQAWYEADVWFYPTSFQETYCITALEAQASGALCVYAPVAALCDTVGERGIALLERNLVPTEKEYEQMATNVVCGALTAHRDALQAKILKARDWAMQQTWQAVAKQWLQLQ